MGQNRHTLIIHMRQTYSGRRINWKIICRQKKYHRNIDVKYEQNTNNYKHSRVIFVRERKRGR